MSKEPTMGRHSHNDVRAYIDARIEQANKRCGKSSPAFPKPDWDNIDMTGMFVLICKWGYWAAEAYYAGREITLSQDRLARIGDIMPITRADFGDLRTVADALVQNMRELSMDQKDSIVWQQACALSTAIDTIDDLAIPNS